MLEVVDSKLEDTSEYICGIQGDDLKDEVQELDGNNGSSSRYLIFFRSSLLFFLLDFLLISLSQVPGERSCLSLAYLLEKTFSQF